MPRFAIQISGASSPAFEDKRTLSELCEDARAEVLVIEVDGHTVAVFTPHIQAIAALPDER